MNWPVGLGGKGNEGVTGLVKQTPDSIGYVELIYAVQNKIPYGTVKKRPASSSRRVWPACRRRQPVQPSPCRTISGCRITNAPGKTAYPISSFTWLLIPEKISDAAKRDAIKDFLKWMMTDGQNDVEALAYAKLPKEVVAKEKKAIGKDPVTDPEDTVATTSTTLETRGPVTGLAQPFCAG